MGHAVRRAGVEHALIGAAGEQGHSVGVWHAASVPCGRPVRAVRSGYRANGLPTTPRVVLGLTL